MFLLRGRRQDRAFHSVVVVRRPRFLPYILSEWSPAKVIEHHPYEPGYSHTQHTFHEPQCHDAHLPSSIDEHRLFTNTCTVVRSSRPAMPFSCSLFLGDMNA